MLNHASRTRFPVGRVLVPAGVLSRRFLNSPAMIWIIPGPSPSAPNAEVRTRNAEQLVELRAAVPRSEFRVLRSCARRKGCQPRLEGAASLPLVQLQTKRHVARLRQPI